jgi:hypothetical protein
MCWNKETSLISFILGTVINVGVLLYMKKEEITIICIIWQFILLMQLAEYFIWLDPNCGKTNEKGTKAALILNLLQPIFVFMVLINKFTGSSLMKIASSIIIFIYISYMMLKLNEYQNYTCVTKVDKCSHLNFQWWNDFSGGGMIYLITLISIIFLLYRPLKPAIFVSSYILLMLLISQKFYSCGQPSTWCWLVVPMPLFLLIFYKLTNKQTI